MFDLCNRHRVCDDKNPDHFRSGFNDPRLNSNWGANWRLQVKETIKIKNCGFKFIITNKNIASGRKELPKINSKTRSRDCLKCSSVSLPCTVCNSSGAKLQGHRTTGLLCLYSYHEYRSTKKLFLMRIYGRNFCGVLWIDFLSDAVNKRRGWLVWVMTIIAVDEKTFYANKDWIGHIVYFSSSSSRIKTQGAS